MEGDGLVLEVGAVVVVDGREGVDVFRERALGVPFGVMGVDFEAGNFWVRGVVWLTGEGLESEVDLRVEEVVRARPLLTVRCLLSTALGSESMSSDPEVRGDASRAEVGSLEVGSGICLANSCSVKGSI